MEVPTSSFFPALNACLNAAATFFLLLGYIAIKSGKPRLHQALMGVAFLISAAFLASYLYYHFNFQAGRFQAEGFVRVFYFAMLISHIILAAISVPFIIRMLWFAVKGRFAEHKRLARWVWPVWMYVSITGVLIYLFLYHWFAQPQGVV